VILLAGIRSEPALSRVADELNDVGAPVAWFDQRCAPEASCRYRVDGDGMRGTLRLGRKRLRLEDVTAVYTRLMDDRFLPELRGLPEDAPERVVCRRLHDTFTTWLELAPGRVVNRASAMASNGSKPYQAQVISAAGFDVPETLVTNEPDLVRDFVAAHGRVIYKSVSGTRSIVRELDDDALARLNDIRWCPVQFQAYVDGVDVRVHVIGREVFSTRVSSAAADYRYASRDGGLPARLEPTRLSEIVEQRCVELTERLGLRFSGIDLRITPDGRAVCFEANPCPAYSYYEGHTGQPIARAVARYLAGLAA
jgi:glutathione synthase/RimK-type ligase-like ATP-grasp enzyme